MFLVVTRLVALRRPRGKVTVHHRAVKPGAKWGAHLRLGIIAAVVLLASCSSNEKPPLLGYDSIRAAIDLQHGDATGAVTASSAPAARLVTEYDHTLIGGMDETGLGSGPGGSTRSTKTAFIEATKATDGAITVDIVRVREVRVAKAAANDQPPARDLDDAEMRVGAGGRLISWRPTAYEHDCQPDRPYCLRRIVDRLPLSPDDVRVLLGDNSREILVATAFGKYTDWRLDKHELTAVLDALGARESFR